MASNLIVDLSPQELQTLINTPAMQPPAGVQSNFIDPKNRNRPLFIETSVFLAFAAIFLLNRAYIKALRTKRLTWDDLTILIAAVGTFAYYTASIWGAVKGKVGRHLWDISVAQITENDTLIPLYLMNVLPVPTMLFVKVSFFIMYLQIFRPFRWVRFWAWLGIAVTSTFYAAMAITLFVAATPRPSETWVTHLASPSEQVGMDLAIPGGAVGLFIDLWIMILPLPLVSKLQLPKKKKAGVIVIFGTGSLACIASVFSIYYRSVLNSTTDVMWAIASVNILNLTELSIGIICACMPAAAYTFRDHSSSVKNLLVNGRLRFADNLTLRSYPVRGRTEGKPRPRRWFRWGYGSAESIAESDSDRCALETDKSDKYLRDRAMSRWDNQHLLNPNYGWGAVRTVIEGGGSGSIDEESGRGYGRNGSAASIFGGITVAYEMTSEETRAPEADSRRSAWLIA